MKGVFDGEYSIHQLAILYHLETVSPEKGKRYRQRLKDENLEAYEELLETEKELLELEPDLKLVLLGKKPPKGYEDCNFELI